MKKFLLSTLMLGAVTLTLSAQTGTAEAPLSVDDFLALGIPETAVADTYVKGYIVGYVNGGKLETDSHFDLSGIQSNNNTNLLIAGSSSETNVEMCIPVALPSGKVRDALNLFSHPENLKHNVILCGSREKYFNVNGLKAVTSYTWVGEAPVPPVVTPPTEAETGTKEKPLTVTEYLALGTPATPVANTWVTGFIVGSIAGKSLDNAEMGASANSSETNILIAATQNPASVSECLPVQLPAGDIRAVLNLQANPGNVGKTVVLCGTRANYFGVLGVKDITEYTLDGQVIVPTLPAGTYYKGLTSNAEGWTLDEGMTLPEGLNYVWAWDSQYGLKAQAYVSGTRYATDIYAVSPVIDLTNAKTAELTFAQALNYASTGNDVVSTAVREENGEWAAVEVEGLPEGNNWTFVDSKADLNAYAGKKIQIGFRYTSTTDVAATWEIKNLIVAEANSDGVEVVIADANVYVNGNDIVAPAEARVFNLQGIETGMNSLPAGIYVVVVANKDVKVLVK